MDEKTNVTMGASADRDGDTKNSQADMNAASPTSSQETTGFVPMNLIDDLWPDSEETLVSQGKVAMSELFDAETENNVTPISAADLLAAPVPESSSRVESPGSFRSVSDFEQEFKNYGSQASEPVEDKSAVDLPAVTAPIISDSPVGAPLERESNVDDVPVTVQTTVTETMFSYTSEEEGTVALETVSETTVSSFVADSVEEPKSVTASEVPVSEPASATPVSAAATAARSSVADFLKDADDTQATHVDSVSDPVAVAGTSAVRVTQEVQAIPDVKPATTEGSPVPNAIEEEAAAEAKEIEERKRALVAAQMGAMQAGFQSDAANEEPAEAEEEPIEQGISVITREATVLGDIITQGHIDIVGRVKGNIDAKGDVAIHGIVRGDVGGSKIGLYDCRVKGNLDAALGVIVDESSIIGGDVKTKNIIFDGKVKGNIDAENVVVLRSHSLTLGDVSAASLAVEPGAILNGTVKTLVDGDLEAPFEEVM